MILLHSKMNLFLLKVITFSYLFTFAPLKADHLLYPSEGSMVNQIHLEVSFYLLLVLGLLLVLYYLSKTPIQKTIIMLMFPLAIAVSVSIIIEKLENKDFADIKYNDVQTKVATIRSRIENQVQTSLGISQSLIIFMRSKNFQFTTTEFNSISQSILDSDPSILHIAVAKDLVINLLYPFSEANNKALGLDYKKNAEQWPPIKRAINTQKALLAGPVNLVQGGVAFIGRLPIFYKGNQNSNQLWGLLSVVIDMEKLFRAAGLYVDNDLDIAIRGTDATGAEGVVFFGDEQIFTEPSVLKNVSLPAGSWQISAKPKTGWQVNSPNILWIRLSVLAFYLLIGAFIIFRATQHKKQTQINKQLQTEINEKKLLEIEQKLLNKQLLQSHKLEAIGKLTGGIAHDFNNILAAINGYAQLSKMLTDKTSRNDKLPYYLEEVIKAGERAKNLVQQMLTFSRGDTIKPQVISPYTITRETISMLEATIPASIKLVTNYVDTDSKIQSDPIQFQQVILNLIVNSRDAISEQMGEIKVSIEKNTITDKLCSSCKKVISDQYLHITVADTGYGISEQHLDNVFQPFYSTKDTGDGSGMGLSVVHGIVHAANGHILLKSKSDSGTTIKLLFPISENTDVEITDLPETEIAKPDKIDGHVLIIDDEIAITGLINSLVSEMELQTTVFNDPVKALGYFKKQGATISLIITDQTMPSMTGAELIQQIRQENSKVPIILCTGYSDVVDINSSKALGVTQFLTKPVDMNHLSDVIYKLHC